MSIRFAHAADIHFDGPNQEAALASLTTLAEHAEQDRPDFVVLAGDLFNRGVTNSGASGFPRLISVIARILRSCPIYAVSGTVTHDLPGSYEALTRIAARNPFYMLDPDGSYIFQSGEDGEEERCLILGLPEPTKEWLLAGANGTSADETNERVKAELRKILLGQGARRAEHPEIPCVYVYHGAVTGASMCNGQLVEGGISIGREDLELVGADYYALGHIHIAQQIGGLYAFYSGSAYPCNWGETDQKVCNLVDLWPEGLKGVGVVRIPFPHPPRRKIERVWGDGQVDDASELDGYQVWQAWKAPKEADVDKDALLRALLENGALPGSRVTVETIPTETVRAAAITEKHALRDKLAVYAEASGEILTPGVNEKADALEREAEASGTAPEGLHIRLRTLRLRGAIGIWRGLHVDEITLDLDRYDAGLIALVGPNGAGKTTLIENMHPYPCMLTRDGTLQQHFRLRDSLRELTFTDERSGDVYRALIQIDGANASGSCEYHLFRNGEPLTNGRKADYEAAIGKLFGSLPLFLRSAFVSQKATKNNPDLAEATKGEKKAIFRELAGLDYLQLYAESAHSKAVDLGQQIAEQQAVIGAKEEMLAGLPGIRADLGDQQAFLAAAKDNEGKALETGKSLKSVAEKLQAEVLEFEKSAEREKGLRRQIEGKRAQVTQCETSAARAQQAIAGKGPAEAVVARVEELRRREGEENERQSKVNAERARISGEHSAALAAHRDAERAVQDRISSARTQKAHMEGDRRVSLAQVDRLTEDLAAPVRACPKCGYVDPEIETRRTTWQADLEVAQERVYAIDQEIVEKDKEIEAATAEIPTPPQQPTLPVFDDTALKEIRRELASSDLAVAQEVLRQAQKAQSTIEAAALQKEALGEEIGGLEREAEKIRLTLDGSLPRRYQAALSDLEAARETYSKAREIVVSLGVEVRTLQETIAELEGLEAEIAERKEKVEAAQADLADWRYLDRACGPDGIQALELDALGPGIAEIANRLLSAAYGGRFGIEFRTTRIAGKGSRTKQVEDFAIYILDNENGSEQELSTLSGGEGVWIKRAIYDAFGIIRDRSTGTRFLTVFQDEADGALDPEARRAYFEMLRAAHAESGRRHTVVITHSAEAQDAIGQKIVMGELGGEKA